MPACSQCDIEYVASLWPPASNATVGGTVRDQTSRIPGTAPPRWEPQIARDVKTTWLMEGNPRLGTADGYLRVLMFAAGSPFKKKGAARSGMFSHLFPIVSVGCRRLM